VRWGAQFSTVLGVALVGLGTTVVLSPTLLSNLI
jgi:hypothetical protein